MAAHEHAGSIPQHLRQRGAQRVRGDEQVIVLARSIADLEDRRADRQEARHMADRAELRGLDDAEGHHGGRMAMHHRHHIRTRLVDLAMDEAFEIDGAAIGGQRMAVDVEFDDVVRRHQGGRHVAGQQIALGIGVAAHAHMAERVHHALAEQDAVGDRQLLDQRSAGARAAARPIRHGMGETMHVAIGWAEHGPLLSPPLCWAGEVWSGGLKTPSN